MIVKENDLDTEKDYQDVVDSDFKDEFMTMIEVIEEKLTKGGFQDVIGYLRYNWTDKYYDMSLLDEKDKEIVLDLLVVANKLIMDASAKLYRANKMIDDKTFIG